MKLAWLTWSRVCVMGAAGQVARVVNGLGNSNVKEAEHYQVRPERSTRASFARAENRARARVHKHHLKNWGANKRTDKRLHPLHATPGRPLAIAPFPHPGR